MNASASSTRRRMGFHRILPHLALVCFRTAKCLLTRVACRRTDARARNQRHSGRGSVGAHCRTESCTGWRRARPSGPAGLHCFEGPKPGAQSASPRARHRIGWRTKAVFALPAPSGEAWHPALATLFCPPAARAACVLARKARAWNGKDARGTAGRRRGHGSDLQGDAGRCWNRLRPSRTAARRDGAVDSGKGRSGRPSCVLEKKSLNLETPS